MSFEQNQIPVLRKKPVPRGARSVRRKPISDPDTQIFDSSTTIPITTPTTEIITSNAELLDNEIKTTNPELGESVVDTVDSVMNTLNASGYQGLNLTASSSAEQSIKNAELAINVTSLAFSIGLGVSGVGIPFIPLVFAMGMGLKMLLNYVNTEEDILLIYNILHMYFILTTYPTVQKVLQHIDCKTQPDRECPKVTFIKSNFTDPKADEKIIEFIENGLSKYIEIVTTLVKNSSVHVSEKILKCHNICVGLFTTITKYLELNNEEPNIDMISANILYTPNNATEATRAVNDINTKVQKKIKSTGINIMNRGYSILSDITGISMATGGKIRKKYKKLKKYTRSKKYR